MELIQSIEGDAVCPSQVAAEQVHGLLARVFQRLHTNEASRITALGKWNLRQHWAVVSNSILNLNTLTISFLGQ